MLTSGGDSTSPFRTTWSSSFTKSASSSFTKSASHLPTAIHRLRSTGQFERVLAAQRVRSKCQKRVTTVLPKSEIGKLMPRVTQRDWHRIEHTASVYRDEGCKARLRGLHHCFNRRIDALSSSSYGSSLESGKHPEKVLSLPPVSTNTKSMVSSLLQPLEAVAVELSAEPQIHVSSKATCTVHDIQSPLGKENKFGKAQTHAFHNASSEKKVGFTNVQSTKIHAVQALRPGSLFMLDEEEVSFDPDARFNRMFPKPDAQVLKFKNDWEVDLISPRAGGAESDEEAFDEIPLFNEEEVVEFQNIFDKYDADNSNTIETHELGRLLHECFGIVPSMALVREILSDIDHDGSVGLDFEEFLNLMELYRREADKQLEERAFFSKDEVHQFKKIFNSYDKDSSGELSYRELDPLLKALRRAPRNEHEQDTLSLVMQEIDKDSSGTFSFSEFLFLLRRFIDEQEAELHKQEFEAVERLGMSREDVEGFREVFLSFDDDMRGVLGSPDIRRILRAIGLHLDHHEAEVLREYIAEVDDDADTSSCNFVEFLVLMKKLMDINFCGITEKVEGIMRRLEEERKLAERREEHHKQHLADLERKHKRQQRATMIVRLNASDAKRNSVIQRKSVFKVRPFGRQQTISVSELSESSIPPARTSQAGPAQRRSSLPGVSARASVKRQSTTLRELHAAADTSETK